MEIVENERLLIRIYDMMGMIVVCFFFLSFSPDMFHE